VVSNPEFLKEGAAVDDFLKPDRIIVGTDNPRTTELLRALYEPFNRNHDRVISMDIRSAELTKYAANAMLATKISFINELANLAEHFKADIESVRVGIGSDPRIGYHFIYPGAGYGGSCFPKDVRALAKSASDAGYDAALLNSVEEVNLRQKRRVFRKLLDHYDGDLKGKKIALWGLSFKPRTDDMREAPSRVLMEALWEAGASVRAYDPEAMDETARLYPGQEGLELCDTAYGALDGCDTLVIMTEWQEFRSPDFARVKDALTDPVIFDGRNLYDPSILQTLGITYYGIGRGNADSYLSEPYGRRKTDQVDGD
jgi:UDPglucose 6-dehydrogenase